MGRSIRNKPKNKGSTVSNAQLQSKADTSVVTELQTSMDTKADATTVSSLQTTADSLFEISLMGRMQQFPRSRQILLNWDDRLVKVKGCINHIQRSKSSCRIDYNLCWGHRTHWIFRLRRKCH